MIEQDTQRSLDDPAPDAAVPAEAQAVSDFFSQLVKGIKNIRLYRHAEGRFMEFLEPAFHLLQKFLEAHEVMPLRLRTYALEYRDVTIYEDASKENLSYRFYRDGLRVLILRRGIQPEELLRFVMLASEPVSDSSLFQEDMVTRLWKESFTSIDHIVVEGFGFEDMESERVEVEVDQIINYLRDNLAAKGNDVVRFARLSAEDVALELTDVDQVRGGVISGRPARPEEQTALQEQLLKEENEQVFTKMVLILFQILERELEPRDYDMMVEALTQVLDTLLVSEDVASAVLLHDRFSRILQKDLPAERIELLLKIKESLRARMLEPHRIDSVGQHLSLSPRPNRAACRAYLNLSGDDQLIQLLEMLVNMERADAREVLVDVLSEKAKDHEDLLSRRLHHNSSHVARDILRILRAIDPPDRVKLMASCLDHPNTMIRLEGLRDLAKNPDPEALVYIEQAMNDSEFQMRVGAYRALAERDPEYAAGALIRLFESEGFRSRESRERLMVATALGETHRPEALEYLSGLFSVKVSLFSFGRVQEAKLAAVAGLSAMGSIEAFKVLAAEVQNRTNSQEVMEAAHQAASQIKEKLVEAARERERGHEAREAES